MQFEYLLFNLVILSAPILGVSLYRGAEFPKIRPTIAAICSVALPYIIWDLLVTNKWWSFNADYISGFHFANLPIEEVLFFLVVPFSCLVIWVNIRKLVSGSIKIQIEYFTLIVSIITSLVSFINEWWYTLTISFVVALVSVMSMFSSTSMKNKSMLVFILINCLLILVFNGYLTSRPIVMYNPVTYSGILIGTIPIEDFFYGLALLIGNVLVYEKINQKLKFPTLNKVSNT